MSEHILQQTNKRLTLNLLIQGAAAHAFLTAHHLVKKELESIRPGLTQLYDSMAISFHLNYWIGDLIPLFGPPSWFWRSTHKQRHPFHRHPLLARHGSDLSQASKRYLCDRAGKNRVISIPFLHYIQLQLLMMRGASVEKNHKFQLTQVAKKATSLIWGIEEDRLNAALTINVAFGHLPTPRTRVGRFVQFMAVGYGGVERGERQFKVIAKSINFPLLVHELVKGTAELVCLHGLNSLDEETYETVTDEADQIELETWLLQAGAEMWRKLLSVLPRDRPLSEMLMHIARLDPEPLEQLMLAVATGQSNARDLLEELG